MADVRVAPNVVLSDGTTLSQLAAVDSSGRQSVSLTASSATVTVDSELAAASALSDNFSNPTTAPVGAFGMLWDGTNWDRAPGTQAGGQFVAGPIAHDAAITGTGVNAILSGGRASTATPTAVSTDGDAVWAWYDRQGAAKIVMVDDSGDSAMDGTNNALRVNIVAGAAGGVTHTDDVAFTPASDDGVPAFYFADEAGTDPVDEGDAGIARMDVNRRVLVRVVGSTDANRLDIDASGRPTVNINGTVTVDTELPTAAAISAENTAAPTAPSVYAFPLMFDGTNWDRLPGTSVDGQLVNLGTNNDVTVTGTVTADTEFPAAAALADAEASATAVPTAGARVMGFNGTTWDRVRTANTGRLQVDVITGGGSSTPTTPVNSYDTTASIAAGSTDNHDTADLGGSTRDLKRVIAGASVPLKCEIQSVINGSGTTLGVFFTQAGSSFTWDNPHQDYNSVVFSANAGFDGFRVIRTNLDASEAADVYSNIMYEA